MRINVVGNNDAAIELRGLLKSQDFLVTDRLAHYTIFVEADDGLAGKDYFLIDGVRGWLETRVSEHIHQLTHKNIHLSRQGGVQSDRALRVVHAPGDAHVIATGIFRGLLDTCRPHRRQSPAWWQALTRRFHD
jgi:hypothetical protein